MDVEHPGWSKDPVFAAKVRGVFDQEYEAAGHSGIVVVPSVIDQVQHS